MRLRAQPRLHDRLSHPARSRRRRPRADRAVDLRRQLHAGKRAGAFALYGVTVVVAPAIGPLLGGWLTDAYSWHWIFLINLPVGAAPLALIWFLVDEPKAVVEDTRKFREKFIPDWLGFVLVALTFGCLQIVLDRFQQDDGFASLTIVLFATVCVFSAVALVWWELQHPQPVFDVRLFKTRSFAIACLLMFLLGLTLYSTTQLIPQLAQTLLSTTRSPPARRSPSAASSPC